MNDQEYGKATAQGKKFNKLGFFCLEKNDGGI